MSYEQKQYVAARCYLAPPAADWFWKWGDSGKVLLWKDGQTIAFREELIAVL
ncbi:MAG: hypothetical protein JW829_13240 [Pirellulales bacterium]|nr:hypothetical protein [Pirellulales bacterium]